MPTTRVFQSGNSQAVRIPKQFRIDADEVEIFRRGDELVLRKRTTDLSGAFDVLTSLSDDFFSEGREQPRADKRGDL